MIHLNNCQELQNCHRQTRCKVNVQEIIIQAVKVIFTEINSIQLNSIIILQNMNYMH